ncbi:unnamed protein product [Cuscuta europaea]|uniref:Protein TIFY n=1 Tax=Cuscuta europaea TaxID=41803 RepID=A0A9P0ZXF4_CUSEU|nr:unnamed protein product [Cuscuta europaea]
MQLPSGGARLGRAPEKPSFAQTCNLLSRYLNGKGNFSDLGLQIRGKLEAAGSINSHALGKPDVAPATPTINFLANMGKSNPAPQIDLNSTDLVLEHNSVDRASAREPNKTAPLTIFYSGEVLVFDDFPADKAREVLSLASKVSSPAASGVFPTVSPTPQAPFHFSRSNVSGLPIARRSSLHRFLEKRKDRSAARAPYPLQHGPFPVAYSEDVLDLNFKL